MLGEVHLFILDLHSPINDEQLKPTSYFIEKVPQSLNPSVLPSCPINLNSGGFAGMFLYQVNKRFV